MPEVKHETSPALHALSSGSGAVYWFLKGRLPFVNAGRPRLPGDL